HGIGWGIGKGISRLRRSSAGVPSGGSGTTTIDDAAENTGAAVERQAAEQASATEGGVGAVPVPRAAGARVAIPGRLSQAEMAELQATHRVEFAQIYVTGPGRGGGGGQYYLIRGTAQGALIPLGPRVRLINHTHPVRPGLKPFEASTTDRKFMERLQRSGSPQRTSEIVP